MEIALTFNGILRQFRQLTEYIGAKKSEYNQTKATQYDKGLLQGWFVDAATSTANLLDRIIRKPVLIDGGELRFKLDTANHRDDEISTAIANTIVMQMAVRWIALVSPDILETYSAMLVSSQQALMQLCYYRDMPTKK